MVLRRIAISVTTLIVALVLLVFFFPWDWLRGPINRYVSEKTGRTFEITERLEVHPGRTAGIVLHGVRFSNPTWARDPQLVEADRVELDIRLWPLLRGQIDLPRVHLYRPRIAMQMEPDGRRTWALGSDSGDAANVPRIGVVRVDAGELKYLASAQGADVVLRFDFDPQGGTLPLTYSAEGKVRNAAFKARGRAGDVLQLHEEGAPPFPLEIDASAGRTSLKAAGSVARIAEFDGVDAAVEMRGATLGDLYGLLGVSLPQTSPYALKAQLTKQGEHWQVGALQGRLGQSDLSGDLSYDSTPAIPMLKGKLQSRVLDMDDLGPLIGLAPSTRAIPVSTAAPQAPAGAKPEAAQAKPTPAATAANASRKVLPTAPLDVQRLKSMNADVVYTAASVRHLKEVPLEKGSVHVKLNDAVLLLDPFSVTVAGGVIDGSIRIDGNPQVPQVRTALNVRAMQLNKLFPTVERLDTSLGRLSGRIALDGAGNSVASWLGNSSGELQVAMGQGRLSNMLLEILGLDGGEIVKFFLQGDRNVQLRCAAVDFEVTKGDARARTLLLDTSDTVVLGEGGVNLATEAVSVVLKPQPKDASILSLRSPLRIGGTLGNPTAGPDKAALAGRAGLALALGAINPLLALAATIETGPGEDTDCAAVLSQASKGQRIARVPEARAKKP